MKITKSILSIAIIASMISCNSDESNITPIVLPDTTTPSGLELKSYSLTPALIKPMTGFTSIQTFSLFSSEDLFS